MKRLNKELLYVTLLCLFFGVCILGICLRRYLQFKTVSDVPLTKEALELFKGLYINCEFKYAPGIGIAFIVVGILLWRNYILKKRLLEKTGNDEL